MNHNFNNKDIVDFIHGRMDEARRLELLKAMEQDEALRNEVETMQAADKVSLYLRKEALMGKMTQWQKEEESEKKMPVGGAKIIPFNIRRVLAIAASLTLLLVAAYYFTRKDNKPDFVETPTELPSDSLRTTPEQQTPAPITEEKKEEIAIDEKEIDKTPEPEKRSWLDEFLQTSKQEASNQIRDLEGSYASSNTRAINPNDTSLLEKVIKLYQEKRYKDISAINMDSASAEVVFIKALSFFKVKQYAKAADTFGSIPKKGNDKYYDAQWGKALALVAQLPGTCLELKTLLSDIENTKYQPHKNKVAPLKTKIGFGKICSGK